MSWDEAFANHYEQWSAHMTADATFYIELGRYRNRRRPPWQGQRLFRATPRK